ncbi:Gfo/Idh/MocA family oxidoreductase [Arthrobacter crystallopoietes]|uniref:Gfo/Idh/MocA family oxidoreductase n=1 Tax=Crystallibacter crystallopoietes TaxID=37928 RepID=UPI003001694F
MLNRTSTCPPSTASSSRNHTSQIRDFVEALTHGADPAITGRDANNALRILLAIYESARTGVPVRFAPFPPDGPVAPEGVSAQTAQANS